MPSLDEDEFSVPLPKRQKRVPEHQSITNSRKTLESRIFSPYRTLGLVSPTAVPFTYVRLGKSTFQITTCVGRALHTYDLRRGLSLIFISRPQTPEAITATFAWREKVFAAWGNLRPGTCGGIWVFKRGKKVAALEVPSGRAGPIIKVLVFGAWIVGCTGTSIEVWKNTTYEHYTTLVPRGIEAVSGDHIYGGQMCSMPTYINKVFVGRFDGCVDIWNVRTGELLHTIPTAWPSVGAVTALQPTPVLSLIAIAHADGSLFIRNVDTEQIILSLRSGSSHITSLAFRTDSLGAGADGQSPGVLATASVDSGDITLWDLNNAGRVTGVLRNAHRTLQHEIASGINCVDFLDGQPLLVSTGKDNSLRTWIFDETPFSPIPRQLHFRSGHSAPVTALSFLPSASDGSEASGKWLLSASKDCSLWGLSVRKDSQNTEISQGAVEKKAKKMSAPGPESLGLQCRTQGFRASEITSIACSLNRDGGMGVTTSGPIWTNPRVADAAASNKTGWESIVTGHRGDKFARTWFWGRKRAGRWTFETSDGSVVKSVAITQCGTFALIGSSMGSIDVFNLQSGQHRQRLPARDLKGKRTGELGLANGSQEKKIGHTKAVTGLVVDSLNRTAISCGLDGKVKFWDFHSGLLLDELDWHPMTAITGLRYNSSSELVAFSCDDLSIRVVDIETRKLIREFWGCVGQINDFIFSNDSRWIVAASMDSRVRVWDLSTGHLIDIFRVPSTCTSLAMSSTGEFLATAHSDSVGIRLWTNRSLFIPISTQNLDESGFADTHIPITSAEESAGALEAAFSEELHQDEAEGPVLCDEQLSGGMERNKPKDPPKAPEKAPFFLPSVSEKTSVESSDRSTVLSVEHTLAERSRIARPHRSQTVDDSGSLFTVLLHSGRQSNDFAPFTDHLKTLSPAKTDLEIRSLDLRVQDGHSELSLFVMALTERLRLRKDFELVNAWMAVFLKIHADIVRKCSESAANDHGELRKSLVQWSEEQQREVKRLGDLVGYCRGVVGFIRSSR
ncbi:hypothetical protein Asppvi_006079 [Aspergillus pseudoviridinutans]|uniref:SnoRNA binding protein n=1 Tax=Aspergillus pseudoviridinutans TaxID=1517512 RepID=A0A9P3EVM0_9EURO|nr:uncharacterized protein Asppvi_006079 [Aspergillus pseudoviridinutans]GIJ87173.1 hypothetical protein Asppvi_006079 [Aspergillus pseudoviridinutans]